MLKLFSSLLPRELNVNEIYRFFQKQTVYKQRDPLLTGKQEYSKSKLETEFQHVNKDISLLKLVLYDMFSFRILTDFSSIKFNIATFLDCRKNTWILKSREGSGGHSNSISLSCSEIDYKLKLKNISRVCFGIPQNKNNIITVLDTWWMIKPNGFLQGDTISLKSYFHTCVLCSFKKYILKRGFMML